MINLEPPTDAPERPDWLDGDHVPVSYERRDDYTDVFRLGDAPTRACVLIDRSAWQADAEVLVPLAAGAWRAVSGEDCDRDMAEFVARCWVHCYALTVRLH